MESIYYKIFIGVISLLIQKNNKERLSVIMFFSLLLLAPSIRITLGLPSEVFYPTLSLLWLLVYSYLESNRLRIFLLSFTNLVPYIFNFSTFGYLTLIEFGALAYFIQTRIDDYMIYLNNKLDMYFKRK